MKIELLRSTIDHAGQASPRQHLTCFVVNDRVAFDAGSLALSCSNFHRENLRDVVLTHAHLDHVAGLPLFIDDLFSTLTSPIRVHASAEVITVLERDIFNWSVYPRFSELTNSNGAVMEYHIFKAGEEFRVHDLRVTPLPVSHKVPASGFIISDGGTSVGFSGDTSETMEFWTAVNGCSSLSALMIECAFPNHLQELARVSNHLTPQTLKSELAKFAHRDTQIYVINMKPMFREIILGELRDLHIDNLHVFESGRVYDF